MPVVTFTFFTIDGFVSSVLVLDKADCCGTKKKTVRKLISRTNMRFFTTEASSIFVRFDAKQTVCKGYRAIGLIINNYIIRKLRFLEWLKYVPPPKNVLDVMKVTV